MWLVVGLSKGGFSDQQGLDYTWQEHSVDRLVRHSLTFEVQDAFVQHCSFREKEEDVLDAMGSQGMMAILGERP